jgi:hypothetical protein
MSAGDVETLHVDGKWWSRVEGQSDRQGPYEMREEAVSDGRETAISRSSTSFTASMDASTNAAATAKTRATSLVNANTTVGIRADADSWPAS